LNTHASVRQPGPKPAVEVAYKTPLRPKSHMGMSERWKSQVTDI